MMKLPKWCVSTRKLLNIWLLLTCAMSIGSVVWHLMTRDSIFSLSSSIGLPTRLEKQRSLGRIVDSTLLQHHVSVQNAEEPSITPKLIYPSIYCAHSRDRKDCEIVHIAITSWGAKVTRDTCLLLKSIFLYRRGPIHLHMLADKLATVILEELLRSWRLLGVSYTFYDLDVLKKSLDLDGLSSSEEVRLRVHIALPYILPLEVNKVLVFNSDRIVNGDARELWSVFSSFKRNQSFGAVLWSGNKTVGVGFLMLHMERLRVADWSSKMQKITSSMSSLVVQSNITHLEQRGLNTLNQLFPDLVFNLPCHYNHPVVSTAPHCPIGLQKVKVLEVINGRVPARFWKAFLKVVRHDGSLLRRPIVYACDLADDDDQDKESFSVRQMKLVDSFGSEGCKDYVRELVDAFRTHLFYLGSGYDVQEFDDVTLVTQLSIGRIRMLENLCKKWRGPMSIAIYLSDSDAMHVLSYVQDSGVFSSRRNIAIHLLYEEGSMYPTNHLRNAALAQVQTSHVLVLDVDFMPNPSLYDDLRQALQSERLKAEKLALVVPAFETDDRNVVFPNSKDQLMPMLDAGIAYPFRNTTYARGHFATNYTAWKTASEPYKIDWEEGFEPYFVVRIKNLPKYRENFMGYGMNKIVHVMELAAHGYSFFVLPNSYLLHLPHSPTFERLSHRIPDMIKCMQMLEKDVARELLRKHGNESLNGWNPDGMTTPSAKRF